MTPTTHDTALLTVTGTPRQNLSPGPFLVVENYDMHLLYGFVRLCHVPA